MEKLEMKDFNQGQKNSREDGELGGMQEETNEDPHQSHGQKIPCQAQ